MSMETYYPSSFLSPNARYMFQLLSQSLNAPAVTCDCVKPNGFLEPCEIGLHLGDLVIQGDYPTAVTVLAHVLPLCSERLGSVSGREFIEGYGSSVSWLYTPDEFAELLQKSNQPNVAKFPLLLRAIALLEFSLSRLLADSKGQHAPNNMCTILASPRLEQLLGRSLVDVLLIMLGPVKSLNLRNLFWHGYVSLDDCDEVLLIYLLHFLLSLTASIGAELAGSNNLPINSPPSLTLSRITECYRSKQLTFPHSKANFFGPVALQASAIPYDTSNFLSLLTLFDSLRRQQAKDATCVGIVCLSMLIRTSFCRTIDWVDGVYSSESRFFLTLDGILQMNLHKVYEETVSIEQWEQFAELLGPEFLIQLSSLFCAQQGPRIRERIAHGELFELRSHISSEVQTFWRSMANCLHDLLSYCILRTVKNRPIQMPVAEEVLFVRADAYNSMSVLLSAIWRLWSLLIRLKAMSLDYSGQMPRLFKRHREGLSAWFPDAPFLELNDLVEFAGAELPVLDTSKLWLWKAHVLSFQPADSRYEPKQPFRMIERLTNHLDSLNIFIQTLIQDILDSTKYRSHSAWETTLLASLPNILNHLLLHLVCFTRHHIWNTWLAGDYLSSSNSRPLTRTLLYTTSSLHVCQQLVACLEMDVAKLTSFRKNKDSDLFREYLAKFKLKTPSKI